LEDSQRQSWSRRDGRWARRRAIGGNEDAHGVQARAGVFEEGVGIRVSFRARLSSNDCFFQSGAHTRYAEVSRPPVWSRRRLARLTSRRKRCRRHSGKSVANCEARRAGTGAGAENLMGNRRQAAGGLSRTRTWQRCSAAVGSAVASTVTNMRRHGEGLTNFDGVSFGGPVEALSERAP
jgi:hypothetical protein